MWLPQLPLWISLNTYSTSCGLRHFCYRQGKARLYRLSPIKVKHVSLCLICCVCPEFLGSLPCLRKNIIISLQLASSLELGSKIGIWSTWAISSTWVTMSSLTQWVSALAIKVNSSAFLLSSLNIFWMTIFWNFNFIFSLAYAYFRSRLFFTSYAPSNCRTTNWESKYTITLTAPTYLVALKLASNVSYSISLLEALKQSCIVTQILSP